VPRRVAFGRAVVEHRSLLLVQLADEAKHAVAQFQSLDALPDRIDFAGNFQPWNVRRRIRRLSAFHTAFVPTCRIHRPESARFRPMT